MSQPVIVWFRQDLRLTDNVALKQALATNQPIIPLFIFEEHQESALGGASRWWLHQSLHALDHSLQQRGAQLILRRGSAKQVMHHLLEETKATAIFWNQRYDKWGRQTDDTLQTELQTQGIICHVTQSQVLFDPLSIKTSENQPRRIFTPFWKACLKASPPAKPWQPPQNISFYLANSEDIHTWGLQPKPDWAGGWPAIWQPGEKGAQACLMHFLESSLFHYHEHRDYPAKKGTSKLSPHLCWGEISPRSVWHTIHAATIAEPTLQSGAEIFLRELGWREFAYHTLFHHPTLPTKPLRREFERFPWQHDEATLKAWQRGQTGYPLIDAGMRQLWHTGWMHNRVRMIVASFLVKDLLIPWQEGAAWFWDTLVDADLASNSLNWQWVAGCGVDAAPYFRIFNPILQGEKFDPEGHYVRQWVPELQDLPNTVIHKPWQAPDYLLRKAHIILGQTYPHPLVDHQQARTRALAAYHQLKA
jgi:deoxyribodipyrimidine photo-lyase